METIDSWNTVVTSGLAGSIGDVGIEKLQLLAEQLSVPLLVWKSGMADDTKFLLWLLLLSSSSLCFGSELDIMCLRTVKKSVIDPSGILATTWNFSNGNNGYICQFTGVECWHPDENRVLSLRLGSLGLQGPFPDGLQHCTSMNGLDLSSNNFSGPIPSDIARKVPNLTSLDLSYNSFSGAIPESITNMSYLNVLNLQHNQLKGQIPEQFGMLSRLTTFSVADNLLEGPIPHSLQNFSASNFGGNQGLCGRPLDYCSPTKTRVRLHRINDDSSIGAAVGFVAGFVVALYFPHWFVFFERLHPYVFRI